MMRRAALLAVMILAILAGAATTATAATGTHPVVDLPAICAEPPTAEGNSDTVTGGLDVFAPDRPAGDGLYSRYGWAGWGTTTYDPGCMDKALSWIGTHVDGAPGTAARAMSQENGPNKTAGWLVAAAVFILGALTTVVRLAVGPASVWQVFDTVEASIRSVTGVGFLLAFLAAALIVSGLWFMARHRRDPLGLVVSQSWTIVLLIGAGVAVGAYQVTVAPSVGGAVQDTYAAAGQVSTGQGDVDPGTAVADALTEGVLLKGWGVIHLGPDMDAVNLYAERLYAASAFTRDEDARAKADPKVYESLIEQKRRDYKTVAGDVKTTHPAAYRVLEGRDSDPRVGWALGLFILTALIAAVGGIAAGIVVACRVGIRLVFGAWPGIAVFTLHPYLQKYGVFIAALVPKMVAASIVAAAFLVAYIRVTALVMAGSQSWFELMLSAGVLAAVLLWLWKRRQSLAKAAGAAAEARAAERAAETTRNQAAHAYEAAAQRATRRYGHDPDDPAYAPIGDVLAPPKAEQTVQADPDKVSAVVQAGQAATATERARTVTPDTHSIPAKADPAAVATVAARFGTGRPTERYLAAREHAALLARSRPLPVKATASTVTQVATSTAARKAVAATVARKSTTAATTAVAAAVPAARPVAALTKLKR